MKNILKKILSVMLFIGICGVAFPVVLTGVSQILFKNQANGSVIYKEDKVVGSKLIGQMFCGQDQLWGRPSASNYEGNSSGSSNTPISEMKEKQIIEKRVLLLKQQHPTMESSRVPVDLVTESASGLDPHISIDAAEYQIDRISVHTNISRETIDSIIKKYTYNNVVNVLEVNLELNLNK